MKKNVIFLDLDEVVYTQFARDVASQLSDGYIAVSPLSITAISKIAKRTNSEIVIVSSMAISSSREALGAKLLADGLNAPLAEDWRVIYCGGGEGRAKSVLEYMKSHDLEKEDILIIDDSDMGYSDHEQLASRFVQVKDGAVGFSYDEYLSALVTAGVATQVEQNKYALRQRRLEKPVSSIETPVEESKLQELIRHENNL